MLRKLRLYFVTGLVILLPVVVTAYVFWEVFRRVDGLLGPLLARHVGYRVPGLGAIAVVVLILLTGGIASNFVGRKVVALGQRLLSRIPMLGRVYRAVEEILSAILASRKALFQEVVLLEYPRPGLYALAFVTSWDGFDCPGEIGPTVNVFLPTTPNPTSGVYLIVPRDSVTRLPLSVEDGMKLVISGGSTTGKGNERNP
jgi:uncharacterized membrane protein